MTVKRSLLDTPALTMLVVRNRRARPLQPSRRKVVALGVLYTFIWMTLCPLTDADAEVADVIALPDTPFVIPVPIPPPDYEWPHFRQNVARTGAQRYASNLSDPTKVTNLSIKWSFPAAGPPVGAFKASPIVVNDTVFIGSEDGIFYALDAATGRLRWQYPSGSDRLLGRDTKWSHGFLSSAAYWDQRQAVIFGAQDPSLGPLGSDARLFALDARTGAEIWKSESVATVTGDTTDTLGAVPPSPSLTELHQRIAYSAPLIFNNKVYVGIHDTRDDPIQTGKVIAVDLVTGRNDKSFQFRAVGKPGDPRTVRGGGVWNALATDGTGVYFTTGNTRIPWCSWPYVPPNCPDPPPFLATEPSPNHGLSMIRIDKETGNIIWAFKKVPFERDGDPDWAAGATVMSTSCGELIASVQKDGWSYALDANAVDPNGSMRWQFPPTGFGRTFLDAIHGDEDYRRPGAAWNDVFIVRTGGETLLQHFFDGYLELHALNACAADSDRVRWIANLPNCTKDDILDHTSYSSPTVTGGIVFIGTHNACPGDPRGHLIVFGDPSVVPPVGWRCSDPHMPPQFCPRPIPIPRQLAYVAMPDGGSLAAIRNEPVLAKGRVFVATGAGHVYMLEP
jgi:outer membrane protein assembly factor BamB